MAEHILAQVQDYLRRALEGETEMSPDLIEQFGEACKAALNRQFNERKKREFTLRMSNVGKPLCQLKMDAAGEANEPYYGYSAAFRNLIGDLIEAAGVAVMRAAKVKVDSIQQAVKLPIGGITLSGTYDIEIEGKIYDVKSASPYAFDNTFGEFGGFNKIAEDDHFGYVGQGYCYSEAVKKPFGGWIVINTATGEWVVTEAPENDSHHRLQALKRVETNIRAIVNKEPFKREFEDEQEFFYRKPTGNCTLGRTCSFCSYKKQCWPDAVQRPQALSKARVPKTIYYTQYLEEKYGRANTTTDGKADTTAFGE